MVGIGHLIQQPICATNLAHHIPLVCFGLQRIQCVKEWEELWQFLRMINRTEPWKMLLGGFLQRFKGILLYT